MSINTRGNIMSEIIFSEMFAEERSRSSLALIWGVQMPRHEPVNLDSGRTGKHIPLEVRFSTERISAAFCRHLRNDN